MAKKAIEEFLGTGRRKRAVAAVRLRPGGSGKINVNGREMDKYFTLQTQRDTCLAPLLDLKREGSYDLIIRCKGGGIQGQAEAVRLGIARALCTEDEERRPELKSKRYLTRDPRKRERKKYGLAGARKAFQFSKR